MESQLLSPRSNENQPITAVRLLAQMLSLVFHPLMLPTCIFGILLYILPQFQGYSTKAVWWLLTSVNIFTFLVPSLLTYTLYLMGYIQSIRLEARKDRFLPMLVTVIVYAVFTYLVETRLQVVGFLPLLLLKAVTLSIFITLLITLFWKISAHSVGVGGVVATLLFLSLIFENEKIIYFSMASFVLAGALISARLYLKAHTIMQTVAGFCLGVSVIFTTLLLFYE